MKKTKIAAVVKKTVKKAGKKAIKSSKNKRSIGDKYSCATCGLVITIDQNCDCVEDCYVVCCGEAMQSGK